jgi:hypothetical protein
LIRPFFTGLAKERALVGYTKPQGFGFNALLTPGKEFLEATLRHRSRIKEASNLYSHESKVRPS